MKIVITIADTPDGGVLLETDPPAGDLMHVALAGHSTPASALAMAALQHVLEHLLVLNAAMPDAAMQERAKVH